MKRYALVLAAAVALGVLGVLAGRMARHDSPSAPAAEPPRVVSLELTVTADEHLVPETASVPKDHVVRLTVTNRHRRPVTLTLMGYQDRFGAAYVPPDSTWRGEFMADRPGEGFAWMLEGAPVGRLVVTGSHLVEGHR